MSRLEIHSATASDDETGVTFDQYLVWDDQADIVRFVTLSSRKARIWIDDNGYQYPDEDEDLS